MSDRSWGLAEGVPIIDTEGTGDSGCSAGEREQAEWGSGIAEHLHPGLLSACHRYPTNDDSDFVGQGEYERFE